ncbi:MAG: PorV/PorQ family protein [Bacteroidales bacterium]|nr:PorV/PorQ family protein [Bacteroidales bacterium]
MKKLFRTIVILSLTIIIGFTSTEAFAGNKDRAGQAGANELLINPWAASAGWANAGMASVKGVDAMWGNVAGISFVNTMDIDFSYTNWLSGSETSIYSFGALVRLSESMVLGLNVMSMNFGEIDKTTVENPDGGIGTFKPSLMNINVAVAKSFSNSIHGGILVKIISESIADMKGSGVAIDAGIQYVTGITDNVHFGITLKNIGPTMKFSGDGLDMPAIFEGMTSSLTVDNRTDEFELPTQLCIAAAYDFNFQNSSRLSLAFNFNSNAFSKDQFIAGIEGSFRDILILRGGYTFEKGIFKDIEEADCTNVHKGLSLGASVQAPLNKKGLKVCIDYAYRNTAHWNGTHSIGARILF